MQSTTDGLVTFLPHGLPFICQPAGMTGTVLIHSNLNTGLSTTQMEDVPRVASITQVDIPHAVSSATVAEIEVSEEQLKLDEESIYNHPLFPLMTKLFERCEKANQGGPVSDSFSDSFDEDILRFVREQEKNGLPFFIDNPDIDGLMVRAIQVLRIHVLEIEKVGELCKDFCQRYIASLKLKLNSDHLLGDLAEFSDEDKPPMSQNDLQQQTVSGLVQGQVVSGGTVYQMVQTPQGLVAQPIQIQHPILQSVRNEASALSLSNLALPTEKSLQSNFDEDEDDDDGEDDENARKKLKRGVLPKRATQIMKSWLFQHVAHPYPTEDEKRQIAAQTNLSMLQVNNWFINGRRRILQPMLDAGGSSNVSDCKPKVNKNNYSSKSAQRFWPENIAPASTLPPVLDATGDSSSQFSESSDRIQAAEEDTSGSQTNITISDSNGLGLIALQPDSYPSGTSSAKEIMLSVSDASSKRTNMIVD